MRTLAGLTFFIFVFGGCQPQGSYKILGNIEEPQNEIANTIAFILNTNLTDSIQAIPGRGSMANLDLLEAGEADFGMVDNYSRFSDKVSSLIPLYPQVLHILHRRNKHPSSLHELLLSGKIFGGIEGSGTRRFVDQLILDSGIDRDQLVFVDIFSFFEADVIFSFTDLLTQVELRDLTDFELFSIDAVANFGKGSIAEGICTRYPQFEPYVIAKEVYGSFTKQSVLTVKVDAVLVCRTDLSNELIYKVLVALGENRESLQKINPLLYGVTGDFDSRKLNFALHPGAREYLDRHDPTFVEKYAEVFSVILSIALAFASGLYTLSRWQKARKKNKIDVFYERLIAIRNMISLSDTHDEILQLEQSLKDIQAQTIQLVVKEKLLADESFSIFLNLSKIVMDEIRHKSGNLGFQKTDIENAILSTRQEGKYEH